MKTFLKRTLSCLMVFVCLFACVLLNTSVYAATVDDELTASMFTATSTTYADFSDVTSTSGVVYAGNSAKTGTGAIQLRSSKSNSGIVVTSSTSYAKKVTIEWDGATTSGRTIDVYGKNEAYSAATDLYDSTTRGTKIGSIVYGTTTELTISEDYMFIGLRSYSGALYVSKITITWDDGIVEEGYSEINYDCDGGQNPEGTSLTYESSKGIDLLPTPVKNGYKFMGWFADQEFENQVTSVAPNSGDVTLYAQWEEYNWHKFTTIKNGTNASAKFNYTFETQTVSGETSTQYNIATSIAVGDKVVLTSSSYELSGISSTSTKYGVGQAYVSNPVGAMVLEVVAGATADTYAFKNGDNYLYWASGNSLNVNTELNEKTSWKVSFDGEDAIILNAADNTRKLQWNSSNPRFACYTSSQKAVQLYKVTEVVGGVTEKDVYTITSAGLRFGTQITKELYDTLVAEGATFGVAVAKVSELSEGVDFADDAALKFGACPNVEVLEDGETYQFSLVINNIPASNFAEEFKAAVYVEIDGVKYIMEATKTYSIIGVLTEYVSKAEELGLDQATMAGLLIAAQNQQSAANN